MNPTLKSVLADKGEKLYQVSPRSPVRDAARIMADNRVGALLAMEGERIAGILTERDLLNRITAVSRDPERVAVAEVMTTRVVTLGSHVTVREALKVVTEERKRHFPVMEGERLIGLVSSGDLARWVVKDLEVEIEDLINYVQKG